MPGDSTDSPRTSGGISKSLLTPMRRLGLARKRRPTGTSPLCSTPLSSSPNTTSSQSPVTNTPVLPSGTVDFKTIVTPEATLTNTPARKLGLRWQKPKKCLPLSSPLSPNYVQDKKELKNYDIQTDIKCDDMINNSKNEISQDMIEEYSEDDVVPLSKIKKSKENSQSKETNFHNTIPSSELTVLNSDSEIKVTKLCKKKSKSVETTEKKGSQNVNCHPSSTPEQAVTPSRRDAKQKSPMSNIAPLRKSKSKTPKRLSKRKSGDLDLKRKCMLVIDKHILRGNDKTHLICDESKENSVQIDSKKSDNDKRSDSANSRISPDNDNKPLIEISKNKRLIENNESDDDLDFCAKNPKRSRAQNEKPVKVAKVERNKSSKSNSSTESKKVKTHQQLSKPVISLSDSDDDFDCKKTILIRKSYPKPLNKAKSTGSITQKDIDDIRVRINMKRNALLIKSADHNIDELTEVIKKWRKVCQDTLIELLELMKRKIPEKQNMNTAELLRMLNIPSELVDYNLEDDCFLTPE